MPDRAADVIVRAKPLAPEGFASYGRVIDMPPQPADASDRGWRWWAEAGLLPETDRPYAIGYLDLSVTEPTFDWAERHMMSVELIVPLSGSCLVYLGPREHLDQPSRAPEPGRFEAFRLDAGRAVMLDPGVWHGAPLAVDGDLNALVFLARGTGQHDTVVVRWPDPARIET